MTNINANNYESFLLSYIDGELNAEETSALLQFLDQYPQYKEELQLLQETKLIPEENIHYPNRNELYRREKHSLYFKLWRPAAAAAVLVLLLAGWLVFHGNKKTGKQNIASTEKKITPNSVASSSSNSIAQKTNPENNIDSNSKPNIIPNNKNKISNNNIATAVRPHKFLHPAIAMKANKKLTPAIDQPDTAALIAINKTGADKNVTLAPLASLHKQLNQPEKIEIKEVAVNAVRQEEKLETQIGQIQQDKNVIATNEKKKKNVVVTISGASSNPIMGVMGGLTHLLARADKAYEKVDDYKITSVGLHR